VCSCNGRDCPGGAEEMRKLLVSSLAAKPAAPFDHWRRGTSTSALTFHRTYPPPFSCILALRSFLLP
jgi:hypothetical protein